ncbi:hypothetical protein [Opitutus sp. ER46]|uniref:hypothetical protein n=1 Tax=Opitutus sp. ER46 TaxID=2161864 RepID=UPI000D31166C|nr:hypothetical protein [Opitutus sp. ER46]PTX92324.1 hypothetical protein DB354_13355 [Opitutus sp. ER46]
MTALAEKVAPPQPRPIHWLFYLLAVSGFVGLFAKGEVGLKLVGIGISAIGCFIIFRTKKWNRDEFPRLLAQWERSWVCHRCGHTFTRQD